MRCCLTVAILLAVAMPGVALAQPPDPPRVELGALLSWQTGLSPRITLNLTPRTAIEGSVAFRHYLNVRDNHLEKAYTLHWRQTLFTSGRWQVFGVLGMGAPFSSESSSVAVQLGPAVQVVAARWLAIRGDVYLDRSGGRGLLGAVVPLGRFRAADRPDSGTPTPLLADWQRVRPGREVWVTTSTGALVHGEVSAISGRSLDIRQPTGDVTITLDDIRLVEGRDGLKNGIIIGGASVALGSGVFFATVLPQLCEGDPCNDDSAAAFALGAAVGAVAGGLLGGLVDFLIPGRQTLLDPSAIRFVPVVTRSRKAVDVTITWR